MPSVSVLYIADEVVGPHLELLRNICEPESRSRPHVTVRYFHKLSIPEDHLKTRVEHIDLLEPGAFGFDGDVQQENRTVYIRCQSEGLLPLEHKPYFPTSEFHITVYDGISEPFARSLLQLLREFIWALRVDLPPDAALTAIQIKPKQKGKKSLQISREYRPALRQLFHQATGECLSLEFVQSISDAKRLQLARAICQHLEHSTEHYKRVAIQDRGASSYTLEHFAADKYDIHLTPPELAQAIAEYALTFLDNKDKVDFGDPAVGTGAFFAALLQVLPKESIVSAIGIDISPKQVEAARWRWASKDMLVVEGDYLHMETLPPRTLILANPPYMRHQGIPAQYKQELRQRASVNMGMRISGLSGQYVYFLLLSHQWMAPGAVAAWLIPSEFMQTTYGIALRHYFTHKVQLLRIHQFGHDDPQFENAAVLPSVVVFKNIPPQSGRRALFTSGGTLAQPSTSEDVDIEELRPDLKWTIPRRPFVKRSESCVRLGDLFSVRRGIATGANDFFVLERSKAAELGIPALALRPLLPKARSLMADVVERRDDGYPDVERQLCVLDSTLTEEQVLAKYPRMMAYLKEGIKDGVLERHLVQKRSPWYKQEQRDPAPFLCTYMGRVHADKPAIRFIWNKSDAIATNTYLMLYPRPSLLKLMHDQPDASAQVFSLLKEAAWETVAEFSRTHAGGLFKIEPRELLQVRLAPLPASLCRAVDAPLF